MHLNLTDPRLIAGLVVVVLIMVVGVALYVRSRRKTTAGLRKPFALTIIGFYPSTFHNVIGVQYCSDQESLYSLRSPP